jgi:outer membrane protein TolC
MKIKRSVFTTFLMFFLVSTLCGVHCFALEGNGVETRQASLTNVGQPAPLNVSGVTINEAPKETGSDYLAEIEKEITDFEKRHIVKKSGTQGEEYTFDDCLAMAIKRHLPITIAKDKVDLAERKLFKALRDLFPGADLYYENDYGFKMQKGDVTPGDRTNQWFRSRKATTSLSQPLFRGGALWNKVNEERANLHAAQAEYDKVFFDLSVEVAKVFFALSKARTMLSSKEILVKIANESLALSQEKMNAALISEIEHLNVQSLQGQLQHDLEKAREDIALAMVDVQKVLRVDVSEPIDVVLLEGAYSDVVKKDLEIYGKKVEAMNEKEKEKELDKLVKTAYDKRPEFVIQKNKVAAASYAMKEAIGGWFPQFNVSASKGLKKEAYVEDEKDNKIPWSDEHRAALNSSWNIFGSTLRYVYDRNRQARGVEATVGPDSSGGRDGYLDSRNIASVSLLDNVDQFVKTKETDVKREEALLELETSEKDIVSEVKESYFNYNRALIQLGSVYKRLSYRQKLVELAKHRSEINEIQLSEYIQAEIDLVNEKDALYKAMVDYFLAKVSLSKAIGVQDYLPIKLSETIVSKEKENLPNSSSHEEQGGV